MLFLFPYFKKEQAKFLLYRFFIFEEIMLYYHEEKDKSDIEK